VSYDARLLWTRRLILEQSGYQVTSAYGLSEALKACDTMDGFDLVVLGHSIPVQQTQRIIARLRERLDSPILALLRPNEGPVANATRSVESDAEKMLAAVAELLNATPERAKARKVG
jgi:CheY-like chemotaxis protein